MAVQQAQPFDELGTVTWMMLPEACIRTWPKGVEAQLDEGRRLCRIGCQKSSLADVCAWLFGRLGYAFATLVIEEESNAWLLTYVFYDDEGGGWVHVEMRQDLHDMSLPSVSDRMHAADWHEREAEDLFGLTFEGHPRLGGFVLHEDWPREVTPMRRSFDARQSLEIREPEPSWEPPTIVEAAGAFAMPIGPVFSDFAESAHFLLETVGEDVIVTIPRFFYKYRGVEKIAEGQAIDRVLLLAERFSGSSAFAHGLAFCQAVEQICGVEVPPRARALRTLFAEIERLRHHVAAITGIVNSTALAVGTAQVAILEEELLRLTCEVTAHRYLFGLIKPGGLARDLSGEARRRLASSIPNLLKRLKRLEALLRYTSSFLDRLEEVGAVSRSAATSYGLVGPIARASGIGRDLRKIMPYAAYETVDFAVPVEEEGDGYARLRILFREAEQSGRIITQVLDNMPDGSILVEPVGSRNGVALGAVEAPLGAAFHWVRLDDGVVRRYRLTPPSFMNWHGFHLAAENFAFQDFPIIMASFGLSNAECDR